MGLPSVSFMKSDLGLVLTASAVWVAVYVAIALGLAARYLGLSPHETRGAAVLIAALVAMLIAIDLFGKKLGKAK